MVVVVVVVIGALSSQSARRNCAEFLRHERSRVRLPVVPLSRDNLGQVVRTRVPLSPSSIIWYRSRGGEALRLGR